MIVLGVMDALGGFNSTLTPGLNVSHLILARRRGAVVVNIRGASENGEEWHTTDSLSKKQNCFDDSISPCRLYSHNFISRADTASTISFHVLTPFIRPIFQHPNLALPLIFHIVTYYNEISEITLHC